MTYLHNPKADEHSYQNKRYDVHEGKPFRHRPGLPSKIKLAIAISVAILLALVVANPASIRSMVWAFGTSHVEWLLGDNTITTSDVQSVIFEELITNEVLGEATREISLTNVKVQIDGSDILGLGSESLTVAVVEIRARAIVEGGPVTVKESIEGFEILLPEATLDDVYMLIDEEILVDRGRNLVTRLGDLVGDVASEQLVRNEIARVGQKAAESDTDLLRRAEEAAEMNVVNLLSAVGVENVSIDFVD